MNYIKNILLACGLSLFIIATVSATSNDEEKLMEKARKAYEVGLKCENCGVRNSVLLQVIKLKIENPNSNFSKIYKTLKKMIQEEPILIIRTNAQMTLTILENSHLTKLVNPNDFESPNDYFDAFYLKLADRQVAME